MSKADEHSQVEEKKKGCFEFYNSLDNSSETEPDWQVVSDKVL